MLIVLPFSFGVGFCTGYFWQDYRSPLWLQFRTIQERIRAIRLERFGVPLLAIALIAALFLTEEVVRVFLLQRVLETAAIVVGAAAGVWFKSETRTRDQLAFIAGAGLLLFLAALEYDYKIFRNLSKIGGSEFSVEFTNSSEGAARGPGPQAPGNDQGNGQSFPGAFGLDTALEYLKATPAFIAQDEQYADLFSGMPQQLKDPSADMRALNKSMLSYVCKTVYPIAVQLGELHHIFRGETSVVTINPELVSALRQEYFRQRHFTDAGRGAPKSLDNIANLKNDFSHLSDVIPQEFLAIGLKPSIDPPGACKYPALQTPTEGFGTNIASNDGTDEHFAYFALITSLAELGVGGREAAIHLLEYEIQSQRDALWKGEDDGETALPGCSNLQVEDCLHRARRNYLRRLIVLLRLETTQVQFLGMSAEPQNDFVNVHRSVEAIGHFDRALKYFDAKGSQRESLFGKQPNSWASCAPDLREDSNAQSVFGRFIYSEIVAENNVIDSVGKDPSMIDDHPGLIPTLDKYAREVQTFDLDCVKALGVVVDALPVQLFESVGSYWMAKGTNFGATDSDPDHLHAIETNPNDTIKALCDAKAVYDLAKQALASPPPAQPSKAGDVFSTLNKIDPEYSKASDPDTLPRKIRDGRDAAAHPLSAYPAAEIDQVSPGCDK